MNASDSLPFFMSQRGDSGQKKIPMPRMKDGMKADPSCRRQAILPVSLTMTLAQKPRKIPTSEVSRPTRKFVNIALTSHNPELPEHDESTSDASGSHLSRVDGHGRVLCANTNTHDETRSKETLP